MAYEKDIKELIEQMQRQQGGMGAFQPQGGGTDQSPMTGPPISQGSPQFQESPDQSPHLMGNNNYNSKSPDQSPLNPVNSVRPMGTPINKQPPRPAGIATGGDGCPQCGLVHPPIAQGQKCPMAGVKVKNDKGEEKSVDVNKFLAQLKNIIVSQIEQKEIKDVEKIFKNIIVEVTKYIEGYRE